MTGTKKKSSFGKNDLVPPWKPTLSYFLRVSVRRTHRKIYTNIHMSCMTNTIQLLSNGSPCLPITIVGQA